MRFVKYGAFALACTLAASTASADVRLTMRAGRVSLVATNATLRQILAEWARVGQTRIVNGDRVPGGLVTLELTDVPEAEALDILLRSLSGYVAAPRSAASAGPSRFDRIVVMPTIAPPPSLVRAPAAAPSAAPVFPQPGMPQMQGAMPPPEESEDPGMPVGQPGRSPAFNTFPQPQVVNPGQSGQAVPSAVPPAQGPLTLPGSQAAAPPTNSAAPSSPYGGTAVPGMIVPMPQPQQPGQIPTSQQPARRPGTQ
jgi:hypothetical protein